MPECRTLLSVDDVVLALRAALAEAGRLDNTLMIFSGDNGVLRGEHRMRAKQRPYVTEIPFYLSWLSRLGEEPRTIDDRVMNIDLAPTVCEIAGCVLGPYPNGQNSPDGISFLPLLDGTESLGRDAVLETMKASKTAGADRRPPTWFAVVTTAASALGRWHYIEYADGTRELYDLAGGPCWTWHVGLPGDPCRLENRYGQPGYELVTDLLELRLAQLKAPGG